MSFDRISVATPAGTHASDEPELEEARAVNVAVVPEVVARRRRDAGCRRRTEFAGGRRVTEDVRSRALDAYLAQREADGYLVETRTSLQAVICRRHSLHFVLRWFARDSAQERSWCRSTSTAR